MKKETTYCDICGNQIDDIYHVESEEIQVIFTTEQNEGKDNKPYLTMKKLDICKKCKEYILKGNYVFGAGAMGYNQYFFKKDN